VARLLDASATTSDGSVGWPATARIDVDGEHVGRERHRARQHARPATPVATPLTGSYTLPGCAPRSRTSSTTFTVDWRPLTSFSLLVDGVQYESTPRPTQTATPVSSPPFFIISTWRSRHWPRLTGLQHDPSRSRLVVDYVHVLRLQRAARGNRCTSPVLAVHVLDVAAATAPTLPQVQLYTCNCTNSHIGTFGNRGTIRALGTCLDVSLLLRYCQLQPGCSCGTATVPVPSVARTPRPAIWSTPHANRCPGLHPFSISPTGTPRPVSAPCLTRHATSALFYRYFHRLRQPEWSVPGG